MASRRFPASGATISDELGVCPTASSRKVAAAEELLAALAERPTRWATTAEHRRVAAAIQARLRTIVALAERLPAETEQWIGAVVEEALTRRAGSGSRRR